MQKSTHVLLKRSFLALPDASVSPRMHTQFGSRLEEILLDDFVTEGPDASLQPNIQALHQIVLDTLSDVQRRNEAMLFHHLPPRVLGTLSSALSDIKVSRSIAQPRAKLTVPAAVAQFNIRKDRHAQRSPV